MFLKHHPRPRPIIDLGGPEGNAFALIAIGRKYARQLGMDSEQVTKDLSNIPYDDLVRKFERLFGEYVDIVLPRGMQPPVTEAEVKVDF